MGHSLRQTGWMRRLRGATAATAGTGMALAVIGLSPAQADQPAPGAGIIPQGVWVLNLDRSKPLNKGRQTLWLIKDDGKHQVWTSVFIDDQHRALVVSYDGAYGGPPSPVTGTPMTTQIVATGANTLHNFGKIEGQGNYSENCTVSADRKRFRCEGRIETPQGVKVYVDDFDWYGENPPAARP